MIAIAAAFAVVAGCGGASSSGDASHAQAKANGGAGTAAAVERAVTGVEQKTTTLPAKPHVKPGKKPKVNARSPQVRKAILGLVHRDQESNDDSGGSTHGNRRRALGLLDQIRAAARGQLEQDRGMDPQRSRQAGALHILEMLR